MVTVAYGCCVGSWERFNRWVAPYTRGQQTYALANQTAIAVAYNTILDACLLRSIDIVILVHDDLELTDPVAEEKLVLTALGNDVALVGVAGGRDVSSLAWWNHETFGYQRTDTRALHLGPREGVVDSLEGSVLAFSPWAVKNLRFDENIPGFHGYDEVSLQARAAGKLSLVANVDTHHHTQLGFSSPESEQAWHAANEYVKRKWNL